MSAKVDLSEFVSGFLAESNDLLALANSSLLTIETASRAGAGSPRAVREAFRALHTIKGLSAMVSVEPIVAIAHRLEASLRAADQGATRLLPEAVDLLLQGVRAIEQRVHALREGKPVPEAPAQLLARLDAIEMGPASASTASDAELDLEPALLGKLAQMDRDQLLSGLAAGKHALRVEFVPTTERAAKGINITTAREALKAQSEIVKVLPLSVPATAAAPGGLAFVLLLLSVKSGEELAALHPESGFSIRSIGASPSLSEPELEEEPNTRNGLVRVEVARLDDAMERLSAVIVTRYRLAHAVKVLAASGADVRGLTRILADHARQIRDLRAAVLHVRMVRMSEVLERVPLLVRGLRRNTGKKVRLVLDTGTAEIDKAVADRLFPAIVHLVRNAIDHAIEMPEERIALGKPEEGLLRIVCFQRSNNQLELSIEDDGRGVDRAEVARRAERGEPQSDAGLLELLCLPGLSTRDQATSISGRGMGMEIVKRIAVDELGGEMQLRTQTGAGSLFTLRVPLTITIIDAFVFECAGQRFVAPVSMVEEIIEIDPAQLSHGPSRGQVSAASMVQRRGEALPILQLEGLFGLKSDTPATKALVIRRAGEATGLAVHRMIGQQEVVVRPIDDDLLRVPGVSGATDLGDGHPTLVLDLAALAGSAIGREAA